MELAVPRGKPPLHFLTGTDAGSEASVKALARLQQSLGAVGVHTRFAYKRAGKFTDLWLVEAHPERSTPI